MLAPMIGPARIWLALVCVAACGGPSLGTELETPPPEIVQPTPVPIAAPAQLVAPTPTPAGRDHRSDVACASDADCGWDHPCMPRRCVEAPTPGPIACDESSPPPGTCLCHAGACTLKPTAPPAPTGTCEPRACVVDRAAGRCVADDGGVAENLRASRPVDDGPSCDCPRPADGCVYTWYEPIPCETVRDCWVSPSPRRHPIARPKQLRGRDFKPCADGEAAPRCEAGRCVVGPAYSC